MALIPEDVQKKLQNRLKKQSSSYNTVFTQITQDKHLFFETKKRLLYIEEYFIKFNRENGRIG